MWLYRQLRATLHKTCMLVKSLIQICGIRGTFNENVPPPRLHFLIVEGGREGGGAMLIIGANPWCCEQPSMMVAARLRLVSVQQGLDHPVNVQHGLER